MLKINLKTIAGLFVAFVLAFGVTQVASAAWMMSSATKITKTSSSADVMWLQETLNAVSNAGLTVDGAYGPKTTAAIKMFQMANPSSGVADGIAGRMTLAALNAKGANMTTTTTTTTTTGTQALCPNGMTLASNCMSMPSTTTTVTLCPNGMTLASNCMSAASTTTTTTTTMSGAEGSLTSISKLGSYNNTKVSEGEVDVAVLGIKATARDGSQNLDTVRVAFYNSNGSSSRKLLKYASNISVWLDGKKIGSKNVSEYSDDANDVYTYRFTGLTGVIPLNKESQILIGVTGASSIDSTDASNESWVVAAGTVAAGDANFLTSSSANGRYNDFGPSGINSSINFQKAGGVNSDQKYRVSTASTNPVAQTTQVSRTSDTNDKLLLAFDVKAENGAMKLQRLPIDLTAANGGADGVVPNVEAIVKAVKLYANGTMIANESVATGTGVITVTFGNTSKLQYAIAENATVKFEIRADLNDIENTGAVATDFDEGDTIKADYTTTNVTNTSVELNTVNEDSISNRSGSATGEIQTARSTGVLVTMGSVTSDTPITNTSGEILSRTIKMKVNVTAFDDTVYLARAVNQATTVTDNTSAFGFTIEDSTGATKAVTSTGTLSSSATVSSGAYTVESGATKEFEIAITIPGTTGQAIKQYRVQLNAVQTYLANDLTTGVNEQTLTPSNAFETGYYTLTLN